MKISQFHFYNVHSKLLKNHQEVLKPIWCDYMETNLSYLLFAKLIVNLEKQSLVYHGSILFYLNVKSLRLLVGMLVILLMIVTIRFVKILLLTIWVESPKYQI